MIPIIPIIIGAVAVAAASWAAYSKKPTPSRPRLGTGRILLLWREGEARVAACAVIADGIGDDKAIATAVARALYPARTWPDRTGNPEQARIWALIADVVRDVKAHGCG